MDASATDTRYPVILPALCWGRYRPDFYAVTDTVSVEGIRFRSATRLASGEMLACSIRGIGLVEANVLQADTASFLVRISATRADRIAVTRDLVSYARHQQSAVPQRGNSRIVPLEQDVLVSFDGEVVPGRLLNISSSGAALAMGQRPAIGAAIQIGDLAATVVRHFDEGIGAAFAGPLDPAMVTEAITLGSPGLASDAPRV